MDEVGDQLVGWGKVVRLDVPGRVSGRQLTVAVGFVEEPDGSILVAAGSPDAHWARNLEAAGRCRVTVDGTTREMRAELLDRPSTIRAVTALILRYGTPAEGLGRGPAFRLRPVEA